MFFFDLNGNEVQKKSNDNRKDYLLILDQFEFSFSKKRCKSLIMFRNPVHHHFTSTSDAENFRILLRTLIFGLMWRCNKQKNRQPMLCFSAHFSAMAKIFVAASERFLRKKISLKFIFCVLFASELVACQIALEFLSRSSAYVPEQAGKLSACLRNENECNNKRNAFQFCRRSCKSAVEIPS